MKPWADFYINNSNNRNRIKINGFNPAKRQRILNVLEVAYNGSKFLKRWWIAGEIN